MAQAADTPPKSGSAQVRFALVGVGCIGLEHIRNILLLPDAARSVKYSATTVLSSASQLSRPASSHARVRAAQVGRDRRYVQGNAA